MAQTVLGIDVGAYSVKVAVIEQNFRHHEWVGFYEKIIAYNEVLSQEEAQAATLQKLVEENNLNPDVALTVLPGQMTATRVLEFPFSQPKKVDSAVEFEIESYVPFQLEDMVIDYHLVAASKQQSKALIAYGKKTDLIKFLSVFSDLSFEPGFIGCEGVELGNLLRLGLPHPEGSFAIVNLGHAKTEVCIFEGKQLKFTRTLLCGGQAFSKKIAEDLGVTEAEAEKIKKELVQLTEAPERLDDLSRKATLALAIVLDRLLIDIKQTLATYQERFQGQMVQALYLTGGTSRLSGIDQYFSQRLKKNISYLDPMEAMPHQLPEPVKLKPIAATALSIAARSVVTGKLPDIQFRRGEFAYRGDLRELTRVVREVAILAGCMLAFAVVNFTISYSLMRSRADAVRQDVASTIRRSLPESDKIASQSPKQALSSLDRQVTDLADKRRRISEMTEVKFIDLLKEISEKAPGKETLVLDLDSLTFASNHIVLKGQTASFQSVDQLKEALMKSSYFSQIATGNIQKGTGDAVKFDMTLEIKVSGGDGRGA